MYLLLSLLFFFSTLMTAFIALPRAICQLSQFAIPHAGSRGSKQDLIPQKVRNAQIGAADQHSSLTRLLSEP